MTNTTLNNQKVSPLTLPPTVYENDSVPFSGDLLSRAQLAEKLSNFLLRLQNGAVIAIDSQWGGGKTWFGTHWTVKLKKDGHKVAFINAFEQDYTEDPFLPIAAELSALLDDADSGSKKLAKKAAAVAAACLPLGAKAAVSMGSRLVFGSLDIPSEFEKAMKQAESKSEEFVQHWVQRKLENHKKEQGSLKGFRAALAEMANKEQKPVVVFIDELDRCRPDFAVRLLERIKHFFETPNVVFVLLIHREQLNRAIEGVYGAATDGAAYLAKFVHFFFALPSGNAQNYISRVLHNHRLVDPSNAAAGFAHFFEFWHGVVHLTMREIERGCALFAYAEDRRLSGLLAFFITLKIRVPDIFNGMLIGSTAAFKGALQWINDVENAGMREDLKESYTEYLHALKVMLGHCLGIEKQSAQIDRRFSFSQLGIGVVYSYSTVPQTVRIQLRQIELPIE
ncbi:KAP family NTPase [Burkholderia pseudomultivorans]|uniref:KAP family P-loop NTPase fold protein n=1 Tax=Burkholderia pseudomultivorans TaxID=1207504 RepID=UPI002876D9CC|nr:P-loop NTPase fold protein [Burkholderia pseudomultivorans]MDS0858137.1 KAP family NTPase [Burkholderia pseudomultivorans]